MKNILKVIFVIILVVLIKVNAYSQYENDALRFSNRDIYGTARFTGLGGAFGALGADFGSLSYNPAGMGLYKSNEFTISPAITSTGIKSDFFGESFSDSKTMFNISNFGLIFSNQIRNVSGNNQGWKYYQFGFGINRMSDFNSRMMIRGYNPNTSLMTYYTDVANFEQFTPDELNKFDTRLAYDSYLIDPAVDSISYTSPLYDGKMRQTKTGSFSGSAYEYVISGAANYNDRLYIGATLGIPNYSYDEFTKHKEEDINDLNDRVEEFYLDENISQSGAGVNVKVGLIYRVNDWLRLGAAFHSPDWFRTDYSVYREMGSVVDDTIRTFYSPTSEFTYRLKTASRYIGSAGLVFGKAAIGLEYEYTDYSRMKFRGVRDNDYDYSFENKTIKDIYTSQHNVRLGGELNLKPLMLRAGINYTTGPFKDTDYKEKTNISAGIGYRFSSYFLDFGYMYSTYNEEYYLYDPGLIPASKNEIQINHFVFTLGYKF